MKARRWVAAALLLSGLVACRPPEYTITAEGVAAQVEELRAGAGRATVAALAFRRLGLATFGGDSDFEQVFTVTARRAGEVSVILDGVTVPAERVAASLSSEYIRWTDQDSISVVRVGPERDPMNAWLIWRGAAGKILFLVDAQHVDRFNDVARRMAEPVTGLEVVDGHDMVAVLSSATPRAFRVEGSAHSEVREMANVVGLLPGKRPNEMIVFSASRDHVSGTSAVLELARYYARRDRPERTLVFVLYAERTSAPALFDVSGPPENYGPPDDFGALHFSLSVDPTHVIALLHVDRIGEPADYREAMEAGTKGGNERSLAAATWVTGYDRSTLLELMQAARGDSLQPAFGPDPYPWFNLFELLSNAPMAERGVVAHAVGTSPVEETGTWFPDVNAPELLDPAHMAGVIRALTAGIRPVVEGEATPIRLDR